MRPDRSRVVAYTDGACQGNPGRGGWGAVVYSSGEETELTGGSPSTTNNRMEMTAVIEVLCSFPVRTEIEIVTDSAYVLDGATKWIKTWKKNNWKTSSNNQVKNRDLWARLDAATKKHSITWTWVKGHSGVEGNERADELARKGLER